MFSVVFWKTEWAGWSDNGRQTVPHARRCNSRCPVADGAQFWSVVQWASDGCMSHRVRTDREWRDWQPVLVLSLTASVNSVILGGRMQIQLHRHFLRLERGRILESLIKRAQLWATWNNKEPMDYNAQLAFSWEMIFGENVQQKCPRGFVPGERFSGRANFSRRGNVLDIVRSTCPDPYAGL